jgi:ribonuclease HI
MFIIYADGSCIPNPGRGGYCALVLSPTGKHVKIVGSDSDTTNQQMELMAAIKALEFFAERTDLEVRSDSKYLVNGMNVWIDGWKSRGWKKPDNRPPDNLDLWQRLDTLAARHRVKWVWVRGHSGDKMNELADRLAKEAAKGARAEAS